ncbi:MAG: SelB C-terminal domain-containing protein [Desulfobacter sp.]
MWIKCLLFDNLFILCYTLFEIKKEVPIPLSTLQSKAIVGVSRKYLPPLLEYCDARNVTIRVGDIYKLRVA